MLCSPVTSGSAWASITKHIRVCVTRRKRSSGECVHLLQLLTEVVARDAVNLRTLKTCTRTALVLYVSCGCRVRTVKLAMPSAMLMRRGLYARMSHSTEE
jgi:hypothetical protein